jgi:hypothetical protein
MPVIPGSATAVRNAAKAYVLSRIKARIIRTARKRELTDTITAAAVANGRSGACDRPADEFSGGNKTPDTEGRNH